MPLIGFTEFKGMIEDGTKRQTIRALRKHPIKINDVLYLYWKLRTKQCEFLRKELCIQEFTITMQFYDGEFPFWYVSAYLKKPENGSITKLTDWKIEELAKKDGFNNALEMMRWFAKKHGELNGNKKFQVIRW